MAETQSEESVRKQYHEQFSVSHYLESYYDQVYPTEKICMDQLYEIVETGKLKGPLKRCLEVGCGPVVHRMAPFSKVCETIVYSDFSDRNKKAVKEFLEHEGFMPQYRIVFEYCAQKEGFQDIEEGIQKIQKRLKSKVQDVIHVDLRNPQPVGQVKEAFDIVFTAACIEAACLNYEDYVFAAKGIADVLRPGGYLVIRGYADGDYYYVGEDIYPCLKQNVSMVSDALNESGFRVLESADDPTDEVSYKEMHCRNVKTEKGEEKRDETNCKGCFFVLAQKI